MNDHQVFAELAGERQDVPEYVRLQTQLKYLNNLRLCVTGPVPDGFHGPQLMPHMVPAEVESSIAQITRLIVKPVAISEAKAEELSTDAGQFKYAMIGTALVDYVVDLRGSYKSVVLPQQPFEGTLGLFKHDCVGDPVRLTSDNPITALTVRRSANFRARADRFYFMVEQYPDDVVAARALSSRPSAEYTYYSMTKRYTTCFIGDPRHRFANAALHVKHASWASVASMPGRVSTSIVKNRRNGYARVGSIIVPPSCGTSVEPLKIESAIT